MQIDLRCVPKPRMTKSDVWKKRKCVCDYWLFADQLRIACKGFTLADSFAIRFYFAMPSTWSKKKKEEMNNKPMQSKPDYSNCLKSVEDILRPGDDQMIYSVQGCKIWSYNDCIVIENRIGA